LIFESPTELEHTLLHAARLHQLGSSPVTEILFCVTSDGRRVIDAAVGEPEKVELTSRMITVLNERQKAKLLHNHPSGASLSLDDWKLCLAHPSIVEIVAINFNASVFRGAVRCGTRLQQTLPVLKGAQAQVEQEICKAISSPDIEHPHLPLKLEWVASDIINLRLCEINAICYQVTYGADDEELIRHPAAASRIASGKQLAQQLIK
jgi:hypothetical protein